MRRIVIVGGLVLLLHNILITAAVDFKLKDSDVQVWEVTNRLLKSTGEKVEEYKLKQLEIPLRSRTIPFSPSQTFILLKKLDLRWHIFFWLGERTTFTHRLETAALAGQLWFLIVNLPREAIISEPENSDNIVKIWYDVDIVHDLCVLIIRNSGTNAAKFVEFHRSDSIIPTISKEIQHKESDIFLFYFRMFANEAGMIGHIDESISTVENFKYFADRLEIADLYEFKFEDEKLFIDLVPLNTIITSENNYVLDEKYKINFSGEYIQKIIVYSLIHEKFPNVMPIKYSEYTNTDFKYYLTQLHEKTKPTIKKKSSSQKSRKGESSSKLNYKDVEKLCKNTGKHEKSLFRLDMSEIPGQTRWIRETLLMNNINEETCYVLLNRKISYLYVYLGKNLELEHIRYCLKIQEMCLNQYEGWKKVIFAVTNNDFKQPVVFWVNFNGYIDDILLSHTMKHIDMLFPNE